MRFEEAWFYLNKAKAFRKIPYSLEVVYNKKNSKYIRARRHQSSTDAKNSIESIFTDTWVWGHFRWKPERDKRITINLPKLCARCGRDGELERDHIVPLWRSGRDIPENLQYLCRVCHRYKTSKDLILKEIERYTNNEYAPDWRLKMWRSRLEVLERLNPIGVEGYRSYWGDPKTHYGKWYTKPINGIPSVREKEKVNMKLTSFIVKE